MFCFFVTIFCSSFVFVPNVLLIVLFHTKNPLFFFTCLCFYHDILTKDNQIFIITVQRKVCLLNNIGIENDNELREPQKTSIFSLLPTSFVIISVLL